jgi:hypothetical protein
MTPSHGASSRLAPLPGTSAFDDPRPLKSLAFKEQAGATIIAFFQRHPRAPQVTEKTMLSPTQVEFQQMFKFLVVVVLDDDYAFGKGGKKFDEECIQLLKDLEYPAMSGLSRTAIGAPGSPTNWPAMLAMLLWLVELADVGPPPPLPPFARWKPSTDVRGRPSLRLPDARELDVGRGLPRLRSSAAGASAARRPDTLRAVPLGLSLQRVRQMVRGLGGVPGGRSSAGRQLPCGLASLLCRKALALAGLRPRADPPGRSSFL